MTENDLPYGFEPVHGVMQNTQPKADATFAFPTNPYPAGTTSASTNFGRDTNTVDRSMPVSPADGNPAEPMPGSPEFMGTWLGEWSKGR